MPEVPLGGDQLRREASDVAELLALHGLWRSVESEPAHALGTEMVAAVTVGNGVVEMRTTIVQLIELIAAIDRRLPQVERSGEAAIANAALRLRIEATKRIVELEAEVAGRGSMDHRPLTT
jgi:hypothetical protein